MGRRTRNPPPLLTSTSRTARCGPACRVVWEGRAGDCSPYPDWQIPLTGAHFSNDLLGTRPEWRARRMDAGQGSIGSFVLMRTLATAALLAHVWWLITWQEENQPAKTLFFASIFGNIFAFAFMSNGMEWTKQVKACPKWMSRTSFGLGIYAIALTGIEIAFGERPASPFTSFPLAG